jgi:hypothetical protein
LAGFSLSYDNLVFAHKTGARLKVIHQRLVLELTIEPSRITDAVPWFNADEGSLLAIGTPEGDDRCTEGNSYLRITGFIK